MKGGYIKGLDGVRAVAIILVMTFHAGITHFGWMGVQLFFVLSGFLISGILWKQKFSNETVLSRLKTFWIRRSLRIFPLYYVYLILFALTYLLFRFPSYFTTYSAYLFTYTFNYSRLLPEWEGNPLFTHLWSLCIEEQFYLFFPVLIFLLPPKIIKFILLFFIATAPLIRYALGKYYAANASMEVAADAVYWNTLSHLDAFFMGGAIPVFALDKKIQTPVRLFIAALIIAMGAGAMDYLTADSASHFLTDLGYDHDRVGNYAHVWRYSCLNFLFASFILLLVSLPVHSRSRLKSFFESNLLVRIGRVSYGMYIFHWLVFVYVYNRYLPQQSIAMKLLLFLPYLATVYALAEISFRFYESYFIRLKDVITDKKKNELEAVVPGSGNATL